MLYKGYETFETALPELIDEVKNDPNFKQNKMMHFKELLKTNPDQAAYFGKSYFDDDADKQALMEHSVENYKELIMSKGILEYSIPDSVMEIFNKDEYMRGVIIDSWIEAIIEKGISTADQFGGYDLNYRSPPDYAREDPRLQRAIKVNEWKSYIESNSENSSAWETIPPEYINDPIIQEQLQKTKKEYDDQMQKLVKWLKDTATGEVYSEDFGLSDFDWHYSKYKEVPVIAEQLAINQKLMEDKKAKAQAEKEGVQTPQKPQQQQTQKPQKPSKQKGMQNWDIYTEPQKPAWQSDKWYAQFQNQNKGKQQQYQQPQYQKQVYQESDDPMVWASAFNDNVITNF